MNTVTVHYRVDESRKKLRVTMNKSPQEVEELAVSLAPDNAEIEGTVYEGSEQ